MTKFDLVKSGCKIKGNIVITSNDLAFLQHHQLLKSSPFHLHISAIDSSKNMNENGLRIVMYPWLAMGHLTSFLHISNKFAERGHSIFFILPEKTQPRLEKFNLFPNLITFMPLTVPPVQGLPHGAATTADVPFLLHPLLRHAMDLMAPTIESFLRQLKPHFVFYDFAQWLPALAQPLGVKSVHYCTISPASVAYLFRDESTPDAFLHPPEGFPSCSKIKIYAHEARAVNAVNNMREFCGDVKFVQRMIASVSSCDAMGFKACREIEGKYCEFLEKKIKKPVFLAGPVLPKPQAAAALEEKWAEWLARMEPKTVIFCAFGSEARLKREHFEELILGLELSNFPFLAALKPPIGANTIQEALPKGFKERTEKRGVVTGDWVQQQMILAHPAVGCFVTHCGSGSLSEAMTSECQLVLMPQMGDQLINARIMAGDLRVGVEVEKGEEDGMFTREEVAKSVKVVMEEESEIGREVRENHAKWKDMLLVKGLEDSYMDEFVVKLRSLLVQTLP